jgi:phenylacetate-CoA ligase
MARSMRAAGGSADDMILNSYGYGLFTGGLGAHYGGEALGATVIPMSGGQTEKQIQLIQDFKPTMICCTPSYVLTIADEMIKLGINPRETSLRVGLFGAEPWTNEMRREIEERLNIDAVDIYGLSEVMGPGVACECARPRTARRSGKTISTPRSSVPKPARSCPMARWANWCSPRCPRRPCPSSATAPAT